MVRPTLDDFLFYGMLVVLVLLVAILGGMNLDLLSNRP
jgi:hypothetical protein